MYFSIAASLALFTAISKPVSAWELAFYDNTESCNPDWDTEYQLLDGNQGNCYTFGWSMPGVNCGHFVEGGMNNKGCKGLFKSISVILDEKNTNCRFYGQDDCRGLETVRESGECMGIRELLGGGDYIKSFKCANTE